MLLCMHVLMSCMASVSLSLTLTQRASLLATVSPTITSPLYRNETSRISRISRSDLSLHLILNPRCSCLDQTPGWWTSWTFTLIATHNAWLSQRSSWIQHGISFHPQTARSHLLYFPQATHWPTGIDPFITVPLEAMSLPCWYIGRSSRWLNHPSFTVAQPSTQSTLRHR